MKNKNLFKVLLISIACYVVLSWIIVSGNFSESTYTASGINQIGLLDLFLAPINLFNYFTVTVTKNINGYVNQIGYCNIIIAFICIAFTYGILNKIDAYSSLINNIKNKVKKKKDIFLIFIAVFYCLFSALTGLNLILFMYFPFISTILGKLKYNKFIIFISTIGAMLVGQLGSIINPSINGLNRVLFQVKITDGLLPRILLFFMLLITLVAFIYLKDDKEVKKEEKYLLFDYDKKITKKGNNNYYPIVISFLVLTIIFIICMYNWYYMFNSTTITGAYTNINSYGIHGYKFMKNLFGISEAFGYWTGFTMSAFLIIECLVLSFIYRLKLDDIVDGAKKGINDMFPTIFYSIISLTIIVLSLYNNNSFIYTVINFIFNKLKSSQIICVLTTGIFHNLFINDYFALVSTLSNPLVSIFGIEKINLTLMCTQLAHGLVSLITPFNVYLIAGLAYLNISYKDWIKNIWKYLLVVILICFVVLFIVKSFI